MESTEQTTLGSKQGVGKAQAAIDAALDVEVLPSGRPQFAYRIRKQLENGDEVDRLTACYSLAEEYETWDNVTITVVTGWDDGE